MPFRGGRRSPLAPLLVLLAALVCGGVSRHLSPWDVAEQTELLLEEAADDLLARTEEQHGPEGRQQPATTQFQSSCELVGKWLSQCG